MEKLIIIINLVLSLFVLLAGVVYAVRSRKYERNSVISKEKALTELESELKMDDFLYSLMLSFVIISLFSQSFSQTYQSLFLAGGVESIFYLFKLKNGRYLKMLIVAILSIAYGFILR